MHIVPKHTPTFTVSFWDGGKLVYNDINELVTDLWLPSNRGWWMRRGCRYTITSYHQATCSRCGPVSYDQINNKCIHRVSFWDWDNDEGRFVVRYKNETVKRHDIKVSAIVRDDLGTIYSERDLADLYEEANPRKRRYCYSRHSDPAWQKKFDYDHRHLKSRFGSLDAIGYCRSMSTMNERRQYAACQVDEDSPRIRGRRSLSGLPNSWDDYRNGAWEYAKSWKARRVKKQWMAKLDNHCDRGRVVDD